MDYASFVAKGQIVKVNDFFIDIQINDTRTVRLQGYNLKQHKVGDYAYCDGFLSKDRAYIINIQTTNKKIKGDYEKYRDS